MRQTVLGSASILVAAALLAACAPANLDAEGAPASSESGAIQSSATPQSDPEAQTQDPSFPEIEWEALPSTDVSLAADGLAISQAGTYVLSGSTRGQVRVDADGPVRLILNKASIDAKEGAAIQIDNAEVAVIELNGGTTNVVTDAATRTDESINGTIFSSDDVVITGEGRLDVKGNFADGIVGKDNVWILDGTISVNSVDDAIRGKDSLNIEGGTIAVTAQGDGIKSSNDTDLGRGNLNISGGNISIVSGDDAIKSPQKIWITGGEIEIKESVEGIEAPVVLIDGGTISINASDDGINASASDIITDGLSITINGGDLTIVVGQGDTDALDSNGDLTITGGTLTITARSPFDFDGTGTWTGGDIIVNGEEITELSNQFGGVGPGAMGPAQPGPGGMGRGPMGAPDTNTDRP